MDTLPLVKLERLVKVPRPTRTVQLVINIPESAVLPTAPSAPSKPKRHTRIWAFLKVAGPVIASAAAIVISVLALREQSSADQAQQRANAAAAAASQRQEAEQVSYLENYTTKPPFISVLVENLSSTPITDVTFQIEITAHLTSKGFVTKGYNLLLSSIPACSSGMAGIVPTAEAAMLEETKLKASQMESAPAVLVLSMSFVDGGGNEWQYTDGLGLKFLSSRPAIIGPTQGYVPVAYKAASGCV